MFLKHEVDHDWANTTFPRRKIVLSNQNVVGLQKIGELSSWHALTSNLTMVSHSASTCGCNESNTLIKFPSATVFCYFSYDKVVGLFRSSLRDVLTGRNTGRLVKIVIAA